MPGTVRARADEVPFSQIVADQSTRQPRMRLRLNVPSRWVIAVSPPWFRARNDRRVIDRLQITISSRHLRGKWLVL